MIQLTKKAIDKVKEIAAEDDLTLSIRLSVKGGGCGGFRNDMCFDDIVGVLDETFDQGGIKIIVDQISAQYLEGTEIDYSELEFSTGFVFKSPNAKASCGCGKSVSY
jgi:iron-sulfur cluster assembly accessory protein